MYAGLRFGIWGGGRKVEILGRAEQSAKLVCLVVFTCNYTHTHTHIYIYMGLAVA
jgi:hypothetical protein